MALTRCRHSQKRKPLLPPGQKPPTVTKDRDAREERLALPNSALDKADVFERVVKYFMLGAFAGGVLGFLSSVASEVIGQSLVHPYRPGPQLFRTMFNGAVGGFVMGAAFLGGFSITHFLSEHFEYPLTRGWNLLGISAIGLVGAAIVGSGAYATGLVHSGFEVASALGVSYFLIMFLGSLGCGLSFRIPSDRVVTNDWGPQILRTARAWLLYVVVATAATYYVGTRFPEFGSNLTLIQVLSDVLRSALWGACLSMLQFWATQRRFGSPIQLS